MEMIGSQCRLEQTVTEEYTAATIGSGMLPVFGTPYLAAMAESAAMTCGDHRRFRKRQNGGFCRACLG